MMQAGYPKHLHARGPALAWSIPTCAERSFRPAGWRRDRIRPGLVCLIGSFLVGGQVRAEPLIVVRDLGGISALPYYQALNLLPSSQLKQSAPAAVPPPSAPLLGRGEADMLPVRSARLSVGRMERRVIAVVGLTPLFLVGDDAVSQTWLRAHRQALNALHAIGLVVEVRTAERLRALRSIAPELQLVPSAADDLALRLDLRHYPVLITATGIEQ